VAEPFDTLSPILDALLNRGGKSVDYDQDVKDAAIEAALAAFEAEANATFFPRTTTSTIITASGLLVLDDCDVTEIVAVDGPDGAIDPTTVTIADDELVSGGPWPPGTYAVTYIHGLTVCPPDVARAVAMLAKSMIADGPWDDRGYGVTDAGGFARLLTAGIGGASFSIPEVQAALARYRNPYAGTA
jgi:hypothetical protein